MNILTCDRDETGIASHFVPRLAIRDRQDEDPMPTFVIMFLVALAIVFALLAAIAASEPPRKPGKVQLKISGFA